jgi:hypothetical protein
LAPCTELLEDEVGERVPFSFTFIDEFEQGFVTTERVLECWANYPLESLTTVVPSMGVGSHWKTLFAPASGGRCRSGDFGAFCNNDAQCGIGGVCAPASGLIGIVEQFYYTDGTIPATTDSNDLQFTPGPAPGTAAASATFINHSSDPDANVFRRGRCRNALGTRCDDDGDCANAPNECLTDVIKAIDIPGTQGPIPCIDNGDCPPMTHACVMNVCQPIP